MLHMNNISPEGIQEIVDDGPVEFGELKSSLGFLVRIAQVKIFKEFYNAMADSKLKPGEFSTLWIIGLNPGYRQGTIAKSLNIKPAHMTKLVDRLVRAGYIERVVPPNDRRSVRISLTIEGQEFVNNHREQFINFHASERANLSKAEYTQFVSLLKKFNRLGITE